MHFFPLLRPLLFRFAPERAHELTLLALSLYPQLFARKTDPLLASRIAGLNFPSPVGLAAGFDKDARAPRQAISLGFGFVEVGTLTPRPQDGNAKPRLFRLAEDSAVINRMGFNNAGQIDAYSRVRTARMAGPGVIGVNIGANKDATDRIADYAHGVARMAGVASYLTINISSPNTPGLRALQDAGALTELLDAARASLPSDPPPLFLKLAPDLEPAEIDAIAKVSAGKVDALIISNTTISRPSLRSAHAVETGGLSGKPLAEIARQRLIDFRKATGGTIPLISAGGIDSAEAAYDRIRQGASLVQLYSALVYEGPGLANRINKGLAHLLKRDGFASVSDAVGADA
jgi:dihydroorotate dehydrogenase